MLLSARQNLMTGSRLGTPTVFAPTYWASPSGSGAGNGSEGDPLDIQTAINWCGAGESIGLKGGTYLPTSLIDVYKSNISIIAAPGEVPIIDGSNIPTAEIDYPGRAVRIYAFEENQTNVTIEGVIVQNGPDGGIQLRSHSGFTLSNVTIRKCIFRTNGYASLFEGEGFSCEGDVFNLLVDECDSYGNYDELGDAGLNADGFRISIYSGSALFRNCRAWFNSDDGFDAFNNSSSNGVSTVPVRFQRCRSWKNGYLPDGVTESAGDGNGFKLGGQRDGTTGNNSGGNILQQSFSWRNREVGVTDNSCTIPNEVENVTAYDNERINIETQVATELVNNLAYQAGEDNVSIIDDTNVRFNSWQVATVTDADFVSLDDADADAAREQGLIPPMEFLRLKENSPLRVAGENGAMLGSS